MDASAGKGLCLAIACLLALQVAQATKTESAGLDRGFRRLYDLDFPGAQKEFESWEKENPENPMGPVAEAAGVLFSEFDRLGVLEAQFYEDDSIFAARKKYEANPEQRARFEQRLDRAEDLAKARLARDPQDRDALLAMTLATGLRSDFAALIEKRNLASLHYTKEATAWAGQLLAADPDLLRRSSGQRSQPVHHRIDGRAGALDSAHRRHFGRQGRQELPNCRPPPRMAGCSLPLRAYCWPSPTFARKMCPTLANSWPRCKRNFRTTRSLGGNWRGSTKNASAAKLWRAP